MDKYYDNIKNYLVSNEALKLVKDYSKNRSDLITYYNVGKELVLAGKHYGEGIIKKYSEKLTKEINKKYNISSLKRMRQFFTIIEKGATLSHQLSFSHYSELIPLNDIDKINYYVIETQNSNLSIRQLRKKIKNKEYERLPIETRNKLINNKSNNIKDYVKNPILIKNTTNNEKISEKVLQKLILEDIPSFLKELGNGFTFIENEYKIKLGLYYHYIDLLLYNIKSKSYVVVELKVTELKSKHIGQIQEYMNYIDKNVKTIEENKTIGIIICKRDNKFVIEYCSDEKIISREYELV